MTKRVVIIGGGPAGLSAAEHLTTAPDWQDRYEITVYQLGWRLGGKGATGRPIGDGVAPRIEEHGIHGFCGFYYNTFEMLRRCYHELGADLEEQFLGSSFAVQSDDFDGAWHTTDAYLPARSKVPWEDKKDRLQPHQILHGALDFAMEQIRIGRSVMDDYTVGASTRGDGRDPDDRDQLDRMEDVRADLPAEHEGDPDGVRGWGSQLVVRAINKLLGIIEPFIESRVDEIADATENGTPMPDHRVPTLTLDFLAALIRGLAEDDILDGEVDDIDDENYSDWLRRHGAAEVTVDFAAVRATPNMVFAYPNGDAIGNPADLSAATFVGWLMRSFCIKGQTFYFFREGTGESIIRPLYQVLAQRGVAFEFFHQLTGVATDDDRSLVTRLDFSRQARTGDDAPYLPLVAIGANGGQLVWPATPDWAQLVDGDQLEAAGVDFESWWDDIPGAEPVSLELGEDFDVVVWAMPPSVIPHVGGALTRGGWTSTNAGLTTTATQATQIWLDTPTSELGWDASVLRDDERYGGASFANRLSGMVDFTDLITWEGWPDPQPKGLLYLCGQIPDAAPYGGPGYRAAQDSVAHEQGLSWLRDNMTGFFPDFTFDDLHSGHSGEAAFADQYWRANTTPAERYVMAPAGSAAARMTAWDTGYRNLAAAGDWIYTGVNVGCFEGGVTGGKLASHAVSAHPSLDDVHGYDFLHDTERAGRRTSKGFTGLIDDDIEAPTPAPEPKVSVAQDTDEGGTKEHDRIQDPAQQKTETTMARGISIHIGVNELDPDHYAGWDGKLRACEFDANDMEAIAAGQSFTTTKLLTADATRQAVADAVTAAASELGPGDYFLITYAGHGGQVPDLDMDEDDGMDETWCLYDGQMIDDELRSLYGHFDPQTRVFIVSDSCHSGTVSRAPGVAPPEEQPPNTRAMPRNTIADVYAANRDFYRDVATELMDRHGGIVPDPEARVKLISACQDDQYAKDGLDNGFFTGRLKRVWSDGQFTGSYDDFHAAIDELMRGDDQTTNHFSYGGDNPDFDSATPFTI